jgi:hypothetical protein
MAAGAASLACGGMMGCGAGGEVAGHGPCGDPRSDRADVATARFGMSGGFRPGVAVNVGVIRSRARPGLARGRQIAFRGGGMYAAAAAVIADVAVPATAVPGAVVDGIDVDIAKVVG